MNIFNYASGRTSLQPQLLKMAVVMALSFGVSHAVLANTVTGPAALKEINLLSEQGNQAAALEKVNTYLSANPKDAEALFMKGVILVEQGKRDEAIKAFTDLTEKYPNLPEPYNNLAVLYADQGQYDKARKALETAIKTHPSYATAHENLGDIYARLASEAYDKAFKLDTSNARAQSKLSMITDLFGGTKTAANKPAVIAKNQPKPTEATKPEPATIKPADAKKPEPAKPAQPVATNQEAAILSAVNAWASAWSSKNIDSYLASYAGDFVTPKGESRKAWEKMRRDRVGRPESISVEVNDPTVTMDGDNEAKVSFRQTYKANGKPQSTRKTLVMTKSGGSWLIKQEIAGR
jgi:tetratricopeptide (TPR) repeat protein